jgi:hypothetical protein
MIGGATMPGISVGYARVSTVDQQAGLDAQLRDLKAAGCEEIFSEQVSAVAQRDRLKEALRFVRRGDTLVVCKPDRLARSTTDCESAPNNDPTLFRANALNLKTIVEFSPKSDRLSKVTPYDDPHVAEMVMDFAADPGSLFGADGGQILVPNHTRCCRDRADQ